MIEFILNNQHISTDKPPGYSLLDYIRKDAQLKGTKIGCREGDCGACTVLQGELVNGQLRYRSIVSCLTPLINVYGKHIVTIEGLQLDELSVVQKAMVDHNATQCGFCTPGFVVALTGHLMSTTGESAHQAISGNICRCTGYKSIEKAGEEIDDAKKSLLYGQEIPSMIKKGWLPEYFNDIEKRLLEITPVIDEKSSNRIIGGGTDLMVQIPGEIRQSHLTAAEPHIPSEMEIINGRFMIGAAMTISSFFEHEIVKENFPQFEKFYPLIASSPIRNMGTLAGNFVNASPIGDLSILFLALNTQLHFSSGRRIALKDFFIDYKEVDLKDKEYIHYLEVDSRLSEFNFHFEKVSKRTYLDIASVNTALSILLEGNKIQEIHISAGGVAAVPKYLNKTCDFLCHNELHINYLIEAMEILQSEIHPISDIRGSQEYKRILIRQLFLNHFLKLFPQLIKEEEILKVLKSKSPAL